MGRVSWSFFISYFENWLPDTSSHSHFSPPDDQFILCATRRCVARRFLMPLHQAQRIDHEDLTVARRNEMRFDWGAVMALVTVSFLWCTFGLFLGNIEACCFMKVDLELYVLIHNPHICVYIYIRGIQGVRKEWIPIAPIYRFIPLFILVIAWHQPHQPVILCTRVHPGR